MLRADKATLTVLGVNAAASGFDLLVQRLLNDRRPRPPAAIDALALGHG